VFLGEMPMRQRGFVNDLAEINAAGLEHVLCLLSLSEISTSFYFDLVEGGYLKAEFHHCPLSSSCPADQKAALTAALMPLIENLRNGESLMIHCHYS
jgi:hypothetical protein